MIVLLKGILEKLLFILLFVYICLVSSVYGAQKPAYILDTDMGFDDWLAVLYVLNDKNIELKAITIDCQGETFCPAGALNVKKLMELSHHKVPLFLGDSRARSIYDFPIEIRQYASEMAVPEFSYLKADGEISTTPAKQAITEILVDSASKKQKVSIISIGTATNLADAYIYSKHKNNISLFKKGLEMIYKGGGAFGDISNGNITNHNIPGNIFIPGFYISDNKTAEWNIYANAEAMQTLISAKLPITFIPNNTTDQVPMNWEVYNKLKKIAVKSKMAKFTAGSMETIYALQHTWYGLNFWDTAVTLSAIYPGIIKSQYHASVIVDLDHTNRYGTTLITDSENKNDTIYYKINNTMFYKILLASMEGGSLACS